MNEIAGYLTIIIDKQREMYYAMPKYLRKPVKISLIKEVESQLRILFNQELYDLFSFADGVDYNGKPSSIIGIIPNYILLSLENCVGYYKEVIEHDDLFFNPEKEYHPGKKLFPIMNNDGNCYWVDLNDTSENYGKIYWTNTDGEYPDYHFESLTSFFKTISQCYENGFITVDNENLVCDYYAWGKVAMENNPSILYWKGYF
ncbi:MAG: SMI1/KNR4 family protein [Agriterribacter sp.]